MSKFKYASFEYTSWFDAPVERVFAFHEQPGAFELLTPPWQKVRITARSNGLDAGARVEFRLLFGPFSKKWVALHTAYEKNRLFVDEQVEGPFRSWVHRHEFVPENGGARLTDSIQFSLPIPGFDWLVKAQLRKMFAYRHAVTKRECEGKFRPSPTP
jgi:ligand-binding SRPBCC domain-containing protein